jgi:TetR/AcrR family fatty acid metabolism transcriptional regulator
MAKRDRRSEIMQAAEKLFTSRQFHQITLDDVVREARVGKGTIYRYFQDKEDLFFQTATRGFDELCELLSRKVPQDASFGEQLLGMCGQISAFFCSRRQLLRLMQAEESRISGRSGEIRDRWVRERRKLASSVAGVLAKGVAEGQIRADIPPEILAQFLLGMLRTRARDLADVPESQRPLELIVSLFCQGACRQSGRSNGHESWMLCALADGAGHPNHS